MVAVAELARSHGLDGIIATNTTISRDGLRTDPAQVEALGAGGLSGPVLRRRSVEVLRILRAHDPGSRSSPSGGSPPPTTPAPGSGPAPTSCRPTPASSTAARCGRAGSCRARRMTVDGPPDGRQDGRRDGPLHVRGEVLAAKTAGAYRHLTLVAPGIGERSRPGSFLAVSVGEASLARRALWIHRVRAVGGHRAAIDVVVEPRGTGTRWLAALSPGTPLEVTGPLGRPFSLPRDPARCLLVGEGYAAAPLLALGERLRERGCAVRLVLCGPDEGHLLDVLETRRTVGRVEVVIGDLTAAVVAALPDADVVYAAGTTPTLRLCADAAAAAARLLPGRPRAAAHLRHRALPRLPRPGARRRRQHPRRARLRRRPGLPRRPPRLGADRPGPDRPRGPVIRVAVRQPRPHRLRLRRQRARARGVRRTGRARRLRHPLGHAARTGRRPRTPARRDAERPGQRDRPPEPRRRRLRRRRAPGPARPRRRRRGRRRRPHPRRVRRGRAHPRPHPRSDRPRGQRLGAGRRPERRVRGPRAVPGRRASWPPAAATCRAGCCWSPSCAATSSGRRDRAGGRRRRRRRRRRRQRPPGRDARRPPRRAERPGDPAAGPALRRARWPPPSRRRR